MRLPGRLEWKILGAMILVAGLAVGTAAFALSYTLRRVAAFAVHQHEVGGSSTAARAAAIFGAYFTERKDDFRRRAEEIASTRPPSVSQLVGVDGLVRARMLEGAQAVDQWEANPEVVSRAREGKPILVELPSDASSNEPQRFLELTFAIPKELYDNYQALREAIEREKELDRAYDAVIPRFLRDYFVVVVCVVSVAPLFGLLIARQVTKRLARLRDAASRVGEGDLSVRVAPTGKDELDQLGRAFDHMVTELGDTRSRLEYLQKVSAWQEVARRLAHEIKNPLTPIQLAMQELASKYAGDDPAYRKLLDTAQEIMHEEITSLRRLVEDFSAFAKLQKVEPEPQDLSALVSEFVRLHPEWQPHVRVQGTTVPVIAPCDRTLFRRILANLIENAVQAVEGAGRAPDVRIAVEARRHRGRAAVIIDDNGPGVSAAERQRIFDPYVTNKDGGTGLGLAIVRKIAIDHGGDVTVSDAPSPLGGARFVVEIPM